MIELAFRRLPREHIAGYIGAQVVGAFAGVALAHAMFGLEIVQESAHVRASTGEIARTVGAG